MNHKQDWGKLHEIGKKGMLLIVLGAREEKMVKAAVIVLLVKPHFRDMEVAWLRRGGVMLAFMLISKR